MNEITTEDNEQRIGPSSNDRLVASEEGNELGVCVSFSVTPACRFAWAVQPGVHNFLGKTPACRLRITAGSFRY